MDPPGQARPAVSHFSASEGGGRGNSGTCAIRALLSHEPRVRMRSTHRASVLQLYGLKGLPIGRLVSAQDHVFGHDLMVKSPALAESVAQVAQSEHDMISHVGNLVVSLDGIRVT